MSKLELDRLSRIKKIERWHFWFVGRRYLVNRLLRKYLCNKSNNILDIGCGSGLMAQILTQQGYKVFGTDLRFEGLLGMRQYSNKTQFFQSDACCLPIKNSSFSAVMLLDMMEHVDDNALLPEIWEILRVGGYMIITVPALPWLWSYRDIIANHRRRYTRKQLFQALDKTKFLIKELYFYHFFGLPFVILTRAFGRKSEGMCNFEERCIPIFNRVMIWLNILEVRLGNIFNLPLGLSLVAVCKKNER